MFGVLCANSVRMAVRPSIVRQSVYGCRAFLHQSACLQKVETMKQVDVDEAAVQAQLGKMHMNFVRKAENKNKERAKNHKFYRRTDWMIAATCFAIVFGIYSYTIFAIQQEQFLDDFDMPEDIDRIKEEDK
jgi:hypothetical protein